MLWTINVIIFFMCLVKLLTYSDPIMDSKSNMATEFLKHKKRAEYEFKNGNGELAYTEYSRCLITYGLKLPTSRFECFSMTLWQFIRMLLHRIWIGRWLSRKTGGLFCSDVIRNDALVSAKELTLIFHRMNQLHLTLNMNDGNGLMISLYSINMAETALQIMESSHLIEIYLTAALRVKRTYPKYLQYFAK